MQPRKNVTDIPEYQIDPVVYSGPDVMSTFYDHVMSESKIISDILHQNTDMKPLTSEQQTEYDSATHCMTCYIQFSDTNWKVHHHCHVTGNFLYAACNNCNFQLKTTSEKRKAKDTSSSTIAERPRCRVG